MSAVVLGLFAALCWGLHDFLIRIASRELGTRQSIPLVVVSGSVLMAALVAWFAEPMAPAVNQPWLVALIGVSYAFAYYATFKAFEIGPIALVAPIIGAFPAVVMGWAAANGFSPSRLDWLAVAGVVTGVYLVSRYAAEDTTDLNNVRAGEPAGTRRDAIMYALMACAGFTVSMLAGQTAASGGGQFGIILISRFWTLAALLPFCIRYLPDGVALKRWWPLLALIGCLDAMALASVLSAGQIDGKEFAVVISSCFGAVTVALAVVILKERITVPQFAGIVMILAGVAALAGKY